MDAKQFQVSFAPYRSDWPQTLAREKREKKCEKKSGAHAFQHRTEIFLGRNTTKYQFSVLVRRAGLFRIFLTIRRGGAGKFQPPPCGCGGGGVWAPPPPGFFKLPTEPWGGGRTWHEYGTFSVFGRSEFMTPVIVQQRRIYYLPPSRPKRQNGGGQVGGGLFQKKKGTKKNLVKNWLRPKFQTSGEGSYDIREK